MKDKCVICYEESLYDKEEHIDFRIGYVEGVGQHCLDCYGDTYGLKWMKSQDFKNYVSSSIESNGEE